MTTITGEVANATACRRGSDMPSPRASRSSVSSPAGSGVHDGPLYLDSYQYPLMAQGIAEHLQPVVTLGEGGDTFAPNADAAVKPLFPGLVALAGVLGVSSSTPHGRSRCSRARRCRC